MPCTVPASGGSCVKGHLRPGEGLHVADKSIDGLHEVLDCAMPMFASDVIVKLLPEPLLFDSGEYGGRKCSCTRPPVVARRRRVTRDLWMMKLSRMRWIRLALRYALRSASTRARNRYAWLWLGHAGRQPVKV